MKNDYINTRPLTTHMLEILMDCHEREMMNLEPFDAGAIQFASGLLDRGMLSTKNYVTKNNKEIVAFYVTQLGRSYLSNL